MRVPETTQIEVATSDRILIVTIRNPPNNYLRSGFFRELHGCRECLESSDVDAVLFTGQGQVFSKGVDLGELQSRAGLLEAEAVHYGNEVFTFISKLPKPVIAAINGACLGGGLELALACHLRVGCERARLGLPELAIGLIPGLGGVARLVRVVGEAKALELILTGDLIPASRAMEINLISRIFPRKNFLDKALMFTRSILAANNESIREVLDLVAASRTQRDDEVVYTAAERFARLASLTHEKDLQVRLGRSGMRGRPEVARAAEGAGEWSIGGGDFATKLSGYGPNRTKRGDSQ